MSNTNGSDKLLIQNKKQRLVNLVCACLIHEPRYYSTPDEQQSAITSLAHQVVQVDAEFLLKLALYVRDDLNIRSTANYLVALAANHRLCHPFLAKYFRAIVRLPTDMLEVINLYHSLPDRYLERDNAVPTALRKVCAGKFADFDAYQLAKYNRERTEKRKARKQKIKEKSKLERQNEKQKTQGRGVRARVSMDIEAREKKISSKKPRGITLKQLIRKAHVSEPAESVMAIVGKKYPASQEAFTKAGLSGEWDPQRAEKRMRLPVPETWETMLSAKGNRHTTWQELLDHNKLPFMAMLRNLRNMLLTGISPEHHQLVLAKLTSEEAVTKSRQLPWRFLSAYEAMDVDLEKLMNSVLDVDEGNQAEGVTEGGKGKKSVVVEVEGRKGQQLSQQRTIKKRAIIPEYMPDFPLLQQYRQAIDTAIRIATLHNVPAIHGNTVVFCDVSGSMTQHHCSTRGKMGSSMQTSKDVAILLGLMLQECCERCDFRIFSSPSDGSHGRCDLAVPLVQGTILNNVKRVLDASTKLGGGTDFPFAYLEELIRKKEKVDTFIILSDMLIAPGHQEMRREVHTVTSILRKYREEVNPELLFVAVDLYGNGSSLVQVDATHRETHPRDVLITGFSDNVLRFVAERGGMKQMEHIQEIDKSKGLDARGRGSGRHAQKQTHGGGQKAQGARVKNKRKKGKTEQDASLVVAEEEEEREEGSEAEGGTDSREQKRQRSGQEEEEEMSS